MNNLQICREHDLDQDQCQTMAEDLLQKLVAKFGGSYKANGQNFLYKHTAGVKADIEPKEGELVVNVKLGMMTRALAPQLEKEMNKVLDEYLEE